MSVATIGLDVAKSVLQVHGVDAAGHTVLKRRVRRQGLLACQPASKIDPVLEWAPRAGHDQAASLTGGRACCLSYCSGLR